MNPIGLWARESVQASKWYLSLTLIQFAASFWQSREALWGDPLTYVKSVDSYEQTSFAATHGQGRYGDDSKHSYKISINANNFIAHSYDLTSLKESEIMIEGLDLSGSVGSGIHSASDQPIIIMWREPILSKILEANMSPIWHLQMPISIGNVGSREGGVLVYIQY